MALKAKEERQGPRDQQDHGDPALSTPKFSPLLIASWVKYGSTSKCK